MNQLTVIHRRGAVIEGFQQHRTCVGGMPAALRAAASATEASSAHRPKESGKPKLSVQDRACQTLICIVRKRPGKADSRIYLLLLSFEGLASKTEEGSPVLN
jgi:hypothetical protein